MPKHQDRVRDLEREVELLREMLDLKEKIKQLENSPTYYPVTCPQYIPHYPHWQYPYVVWTHDNFSGVPYGA
jgi:hypothetical protein